MNSTIEIFVDELIEKHDLNIIEPRRALRQAIGCCRTTAHQKEKDLGLKPVALLSGNPAFATRPYLCAFFSLKDEGKAA